MRRSPWRPHRTTNSAIGCLLSTNHRTPSNVRVLHPPIESGQYTSVAFTQRLIDEGVDPSVGSIGDALDNALAETTVGSFKNELIRRQGPWRDVNQVEIATAEWVVWFNTERPHEYLDDFTPEAAEKLHYDHRRTPTMAG